MAPAECAPGGLGTNEERLYDEMCALLANPEVDRRMSRVANPCGDGRASERIACRLDTMRSNKDGGLPIAT